MYKFCKSALLILLIASITASCGSGAASADTTAEPDTADPMVTEVGITSGVPAGTTFDGTDIKIMYAPTQENDEILFAAEEENGDLLNDEVYHRNLTVMDRLNVAFSFTIIPVDDIINFTRTSVQAGDDSFNMITGAQYQLGKLLADDGSKVS